MEKVIYALWGSQPEELTNALPPDLANCGAKQARLNVRDEAVAAGTGLVQSRGEEQPNAILQAWLSSANVICRSSLDALIAQHCERFHAWLVSESEIISNEASPLEAGSRTTGFAQLAFLTLPPDLGWPEWRKIWRDSHTQVAIDTQSNFEYVQNLVVEPLTDDAPPYVAIVEECFPVEPLTDPFVFFDAVGDKAKFDHNLAAMIESCARFIAPGTIDVFPTSQYDIR